jgi:hypothetical protein
MNLLRILAFCRDESDLQFVTEFLRNGKLSETTKREQESHPTVSVALKYPTRRGNASESDTVDSFAGNENLPFAIYPHGDREFARVQNPWGSISTIA